MGAVEVGTIQLTQTEACRVEVVHMGHFPPTYSQPSLKRTYVKVERWHRANDCWSKRFHFSLPLRNVGAVVAALRLAVETANSKNWR
jgi:hypothetical protein